MHPIGEERTVPILSPQWIGDSPSGEPVDWIPSPEEEYDAFVGIIPDDDNNIDELLDDEWLVDEY